MCAFVVLDLVFFHTKPRDWLGEMSLKSPILCRVERKTTTQSVNLDAVRAVQSRIHVVGGGRGPPAYEFSIAVKLVANCYTPFTTLGGSVAEWLACLNQAQKGPGSSRSHDAVG